MIKNTLLILALFTYAFSIAQSTDLDKETFNVSYVVLPTEPVLDDSKRTYSSDLRGVAINGFSKVANGGTIDIKYNFNGTNVGELEIDKIKHEKKDKDGNVVSTSYTYKAKSSFSSRATINVINSDTGESYEKTFSESNDFVGNEFDSYYKAERNYLNNRYERKRSYTSKHKGRIKSSIKSYLNSRYGYTPYDSSSKYLWILGSKKHPEYQKHHEAHEKVKAAFANMKFDQPVDEILKEVEPVIEYFNSIIPNYPGTKRKMRKVKYASYYNIAAIYYYLDMPEKAKEYAQKIIENDYDKGDGKYFNRISDELLKSFEVNKTKTRHMAVVTEDLSNEVEEEEPAPAAAAPTLELNKAYLITKDNDTTLVDVKTEDLAKIGYSLTTVEFDNNGSPIGTRKKQATNCKELVFVDGPHFRNIAFKESVMKDGAADAGKLLAGATDKLCKVLYESEKINLYSFRGEELVIMPAGAEKGKSTLSAGFVLGFKKNLIKLAEGCPSVQEKAKSKAYKNTAESLAKFCDELTKCSGN